MNDRNVFVGSFSKRLDSCQRYTPEQIHEPPRGLHDSGARCPPTDSQLHHVGPSILYVGNSSSSFRLALMFMLSSSCMSSFAA